VIARTLQAACPHASGCDDRARVSGDDARGVLKRADGGESHRPLDESARRPDLWSHRARLETKRSQLLRSRPSDRLGPGVPQSRKTASTSVRSTRTRLVESHS
jgi:hypothetical protein